MQCGEEGRPERTNSLPFLLGREIWAKRSHCAFAVADGMFTEFPAHDGHAYLHHDGGVDPLKIRRLMEFVF